MFNSRSSLFACRSSASRYNKLPSNAAITTVDKPTIIGNAKSTKTRIIAPAILFLRLVSPSLNLNGAIGWQRRHANCAACRSRSAETFDICIVKSGKSIHVGQKAQRLFHVFDRRTNRLELTLQVFDCLRSLCANSAADDCSVFEPKLS